MASSSRLSLREAVACATALIPGAASRRDAELLLAHLLGQPRTWLLAHALDPLPANLLDPLLALARRRAASEPLQYLLETQEFFGLTLHVSPAVLIPRPETELLVEAVLRWLAPRPAPRILDIGTGTGAIALALAHHLPQAQVTAVDLSPEALAVAARNARTLGLAGRIRFLQSDLLTALGKERFEVVVSNPPYIPEADRPSLQPEVRDHEPALALFAGPDGLDVYRRLIPQAEAALLPGGLLALEFGFDQQPALHALLTGWRNLCFLPDLANIPRIALAERSF